MTHCGVYTSPTDDLDVCETVVAMVSSLTGTPPDRLDPVLADVVDPDALNSLFAPSADRSVDPTGELVFRWHGCRVVVDSIGGVDVARLSEVVRG